MARTVNSCRMFVNHAGNDRNERALSPRTGKDESHEINQLGDAAKRCGTGDRVLMRTGTTFGHYATRSLWMRLFMRIFALHISFATVQLPSGVSTMAHCCAPRRRRLRNVLFGKRRRYQNQVPSIRSQVRLYNLVSITSSYLPTCGTNHLSFPEFSILTKFTTTTSDSSLFFCTLRSEICWNDKIFFIWIWMFLI